MADSIVIELKRTTVEVTDSPRVIEVNTGIKGDPGDGGGASNWDDLEGKPDTFPPSAHTHPITEITDLQTELDGKQDAGDFVEEGDPRLSDARTPTAHTHPISDVTDLQSELDSKVADTDSRLSDSRTPTGGAGGVLSGTFPNPGFAVNMATQTELDAVEARVSSVEENKADLVAGRVPSSQLPSYVDDVLEYETFDAFPETGESGKIYVDLETNTLYRRSPSLYVPIVGSPGSTDAVAEGSLNLYFTAARVRDTILTGLSLATNAAISAADSVLSALGKLQAQITAHIANTSNPHSVTKEQVGLGSAENTADLDKPISTATQTALNGKANTSHTHPASDITGLPVEYEYAVTDEYVPYSAGAAKLIFRIPCNMRLTGVSCYHSVAQTSGSLVTVNLKKAGTGILSTKLTIDNNEESSVTAATPPVISDGGNAYSDLPYDTKMQVDVDQIGNATAVGLKIRLLGYRT